MHIRKATIDDLNIIVKLRKQQLIDEGQTPL